jgi:hypothetical protein
MSPPRTSIAMTFTVTPEDAFGTWDKWVCEKTNVWFSHRTSLILESLEFPFNSSATGIYEI